MASAERCGQWLIHCNICLPGNYNENRNTMNTPKRFEDEIAATHPALDFAPERDAAIFAADRLAMALVGERHEKRELVDLVRWLVLRSPEGLI